MRFLSKYPSLTALILLFLIIVGPFFVYHYEQRTAILDVYSHLDQNPKTPDRVLPSKKDQEYIRILAIDGGGIYGILPAHVMRYLEEKTGKHSTELFDVMMGTSTGALLNVLLNVPDRKGNPKYTAQQALDIYNDDGKFIFYSPWYHRILTLNGLIGPKYMTTARYKIFRKYLGKVLFDKLINNVVIPVYDVKNKAPLLFYNWKGETESSDNFTSAELLMGAVSPPGFFPSVVFGSHNNRYVLADGALFVNSPVLAALLIAMKIYPNKKYILVSLGTGSPRGEKEVTSKEIVDWGDIQWGGDILEAFLGGGDKFNNMLVGRTFPFPVEYYRFTTEVNPIDRRIDNIAPWNIARLNKEAEKMIENNKKELDLLIPKLLKP